MSGNYSFIPVFNPLLIYRSMQVQILSKPFVSLHKKVLKTVLCKTITLTISDYNFLSILPLKERLDYNKGVLIHSIMSRKVSPTLMAKFSLTSHDIPKSSTYQSIGLTISSLAWNIVVVFFGIHSPTLSDCHPAPKCFSHVTGHMLCYALTGCPCVLNLVIVVCLQRSDLLCFPFFTHLPISNVCCCWF